MMIMITQTENYPFYLWMEWVTIFNRWIKWWEDMFDVFWYWKEKED